MAAFLDHFCVACGGWFRSSCPHQGYSYEYCGTCGWWTKPHCGH